MINCVVRVKFSAEKKKRKVEIYVERTTEWAKQPPNKVNELQKKKIRSK